MIQDEGGFPGPPQEPTVQTGGQFFGPGHQPADANGDVYGYVYVYEPKPGYEVFVIPAGSDRRRKLASVVASVEFTARGAPAFSHQGSMLTPSFIILMEAPCLMPPRTTPFSYATAGAGWMNGSRTIFRVLSKASGKELTVYSSRRSWFSWHHINCWENASHIAMDITWVPNGQSILKGMSGQLLPFDWKGKLMRITMPNPTAPPLELEPAGEEVRLEQWDGWPRWASPEFGVVNPRFMYGMQPTRYMWYLASNESTRVRHTQISF